MLWFLSAFAGPGTVLVGVESLPADLPVAPRRCFASSRVCLVEGTTPEEARRWPGVRHADWDREMQPAAGPSLETTDDCPDLHELESTAVEGAWAEVCGLDAPVIAIQDSGFLTSHEDLLGRIAGGYDYGDGDPQPEVSWSSGVPGHGTFIAAIVAANGGDGVGRMGVMPEGSLFLQKVADGYGSLFYSYAIDAMDDLVLNHPEVGVLNYSIASSDPPQAFADAVSALADGDILLVTAAANCFYAGCFDADNDAYPIYPSSYPDDHVISVASLRPTGILDPYSHYGATTVDVAAPGGSICSADVDHDGDYLVASGTSYATPVVAGVAGLVREAFPRLTAPEVRDLLCGASEATPEVAGKVQCGVVRADEALAAAVVRLGDVPDLVVPAAATWTVPVDSLAAATEATVGVELPVGLSLAATPGPVLLPADGGVDVLLDVVATAEVEGEATVTLTLLDGTVLAATVAASGTLDPAAVPTGDTGDGATDPTGTGTGTDTDTDTTGTDPATDPSAGGLSGEKGGCGCVTAPSGASGGLALGLLAGAWRRRR